MIIFCLHVGTVYVAPTAAPDCPSPTAAPDCPSPAPAPECPTCKECIGGSDGCSE